MQSPKLVHHTEIIRFDFSLFGMSVVRVGRFRAVWSWLLDNNSVQMQILEIFNKIINKPVITPSVIKQHLTTKLKHTQTNNNFGFCYMAWHCYFCDQNLLISLQCCHSLAISGGPWDIEWVILLWCGTIGRMVGQGVGTHGNRGL